MTDQLDNPLPAAATTQDEPQAAAEEAVFTANRYLWAIAAALFAFTVLVGIHPLRTLPLSGDETASLNVIRAGTPRAALHLVKTRESTPPGWYMIAWTIHRGLHLVTPTTGSSTTSSILLLRWLSLIFAGIAAAGTALLAARLLPLAGAAVAGALVSLSTVLYWHSFELRAYAMLICLAVLFALALLRAADRPSLLRLALVACAVAFGLYTHYFFIFTLAAGLIWAAVAPLERRVRLKLLGAQAVGSLTFLPWIGVLQSQSNAHRFGWIPHATIRPVLDLVGDQLIDPRIIPSWADPARMVLEAVCVVGAVLIWRRRAGRLIALAGLAPILISAILWYDGNRIFDLRNLIEVAPFAAILITAAVFRLPRPFALGLAAVLVVTVGASFVTQTGLGRSPTNRVAQALTQLGWTRHTPIVGFGISWGYGTVGWYLPGHPHLAQRPVDHVACHPFYAIIESGSGMSWFARHQAAAQGVIKLPSYGSLDHGARQHWPLIVARFPAMPSALSPAAMAGQRRTAGYIASKGLGGCTAPGA